MQDEFKEMMFSSTPCPCAMPGTVLPWLTPPPHTLGAPPAHRHVFVGCKAHAVPSLPSPPAAAPALEALVPTAFASAASKPERQRLLGRPCHGRGLPCPFQDTERLHGSGGPPGQCLILPSSLCLFALCAFCVCYLFNPSILHTICSAAISSTPPAPLYWEHTLGVVFYVCWKQ